MEAVEEVVDVVSVVMTVAIVRTILAPVMIALEEVLLKVLRRDTEEQTTRIPVLQLLLLLLLLPLSTLMAVVLRTRHQLPLLDTAPLPQDMAIHPQPQLPTVRFLQEEAEAEDFLSVMEIGNVLMNNVAMSTLPDAPSAIAVAQHALEVLLPILPLLSLKATPCSKLVTGSALCAPTSTGNAEINAISAE